MKFIGIATIGVTLLQFAALAKPPEGADMSLAPWYQDLKVPNGNGAQCCSLADCRTVRYRTVGDHFEAWIDTDTFPNSNAPNTWVTVPDTVIIKRKDNPTGEGVLCYYQNAVRCFVPASGT